MSDKLTEEKDQITAEANEAFDSEDMAGALLDELSDETDSELAVEPGTEADDADLGAELADDDDAPAKATGAGPDRGDGRDAGGRFASKEEQDAADKAASDAKQAGKTPAEQQAAATKAAGDAKAAATSAAPAGEAAKAPEWKPMQIRDGKVLLPVEEAKVIEQGDHMIIAVPKKDFNQFQHRISRGISAERQWREIHKTRQELDFEKAAPKPRSDAEIEADLFMKALGEQINELFTPEQLDNLKLRVQIAQRDEKDTFAKTETARRAEVDSGDAWTKSQVETLTNEAFDLMENHPELKGMTPEQLESALREVAMEVRDKLVFKENGETFANTELLFKLLKREFLSSGRPAPAAAGTPETPKKTTDAERFNGAQDTAAKPATTSLKAGRKPSAPAPSRPSRERVLAAAQRDERQDAEDALRKTKRRMMSSATLDWDDEDDTT